MANLTRKGAGNRDADARGNGRKRGRSGERHAHPQEDALVTDERQEVARRQAGERAGDPHRGGGQSARRGAGHRVAPRPGAATRVSKLILKSETFCGQQYTV